MNFLALLLPVMNSLIEKIFPDKVEQERAKAETLKVLAQADQEEWKAKSGIIIAEASGASPAQRNWRPHLMYLFMALIAMNYIVIPTLAVFGLTVTEYKLPPEMWTLLEISVGGYIVGRSGEKIANNFNDGAFFSRLRREFGGLSQKQVDALNRALKEAKND